ncbi:MAG: segregation/condensation protein A [Candidatus Nitrohelix vancouverensis]|uniref:Segregation and condensation protein A n=1 Tax=Candidatus Nitrohelix vancouverensis TaxID=2705534 RepID=A0A7T0C3Z0_9BACT|nr:MAG: segregation/condensation protein A [Candidatus Nitrohelix vancouverensis]
MNYQCRLDIFEGPLDLLLHLIKEQKMDVHDIPIAQITRQYLEYLDMLRELNLDLVGEYLIMAAELTRIKSRMLLPVEPKEHDDEVDPDAGEDPRDELTRRLIEYQRFKDAAFQLRKMEYDHQQVFVRGSPLTIAEKEDEGFVEANVFDLLTAFKKIVSNQVVKKDYEIKITTLSVSDRIAYILDILNASESITFDSLFTSLNTKQEIIVTFLAVLESMRMSLIRIQQSQRFGIIRVYAAADKAAQEEALKQYDMEQKDETSIADLDSIAE